MSNKDEIQVDLSDDETLAELEQDGPDEPDQQQPPEMRSAPSEPDDDDRTASQQELFEAAQEDAVRRLQNADGDCDAAIDEAVESLEQHSQQLQQAKQQKQQAEQRIERLEMTKGRVRDQRPEYDVIQTLAGGISLEVPHDDEDAYDRLDLINEIDETVEALEGQVDDLEDRIDSMEQSAQQTQLAIQQLQSKGEIDRALDD
mgnify:CR=1 FL=1